MTREPKGDLRIVKPDLMQRTLPFQIPAMAVAHKLVFPGSPAT